MATSSTTNPTVALLSPGDMGSSIAAALIENEIRVITNLADRSDRTVALSREVGVEEIEGDEELLDQADLIISILVPAQAAAAVDRISAVAKANGSTATYVDANAIAPATVQALAETAQGAGLGFVDAGIIGPPQRGGVVPKLYASGPDTAAFAGLADHGLDVRVIGEAIGQASALKMTYAAFTKGSMLLTAGILAAADRLGAYDDLVAEFADSQADRFGFFERVLPGIAPKAHRWEGEMEEISATLASAGLPGAFHLGAAEMCDLIAQTPAGAETPENRTSRSVAEFVAEIAEIAGSNDTAAG